MTWLNQSNRIAITRQVLLPLSGKKYVDEILRDVVLMDASLQSIFYSTQPTLNQSEQF